MAKHTMDTMHAVLSVPYTLTAGPAAGTYVAELRRGRIVASTFPGSDRVVVPAQDFDAETGAQSTGFLQMPEEGVLTAVTTTELGTVGLVRLVGASTDMLARLTGDDPSSLAAGQPVSASWGEDGEGNKELLGFVAVDTIDESSTPRPLEDPAEPPTDTGYRLELNYEHSYGPYYGTLFDQVADQRRIVGVRCPKCRNVLLPPREMCDTCFVRTGEWVDIPDTGVIQGCSVVHIEFLGQRAKPPYIYAEIILDGSSTRLIHTVGNVDVDDMKSIKPGDRVRAVWREGATSGSLSDIECFEPMTDDR